MESQVFLVKMNPSEAKHEEGEFTIHYSFAKSLVGDMLLASTTQGLCYLSFIIVDKKGALKELKEHFPKALCIEQMDAYQELALNLIIGCKDANREPLPLLVQGTDFQLTVWSELLSVPFGKTISYRELAKRIHRPNASRAVGTAVGCNPISILIPCHRVIRASGKLGGYHWGLQRKIALLAWEKEELAKLT